MKKFEVMERIKAELTEPAVRLVILFGSQAAGVTHPGSGVDVAVDLVGTMSPVRQGELGARLSMVLGAEVDVTDLRKAQGEFLAQIVLGGEVAVKRESSLLAELAIKAREYREDTRPMVLRALMAKVRRCLNG